MAKTFSQIRKEVGKAGYVGGTTKKKKDFKDIKVSDYDFSYLKSDLEREINFNSFGSDMDSVNKMIDDAYKGWQSPETMQKTKASIENMRSRVSSYNDYHRLFGDRENSLSDLSKYYSEAFDNWDNLAEMYGGYESADAYNKAVEAARKKAAYNKRLREANLLAENSELAYLESNLRTAKAKKEEADSKEDDYISDMNYVHYNDTSRSRGRAGASYRNNMGSKKSINSIGYSSIEELEKAIAEKKSFISDATIIQDERKALNSEDFEKFVEIGKAQEFKDLGLSTVGNKVEHFKQHPTAMKGQLSTVTDEYTLRDKPELALAAYGTEEEQSIYNFYLGQESEGIADKGTADRYIETIMPRLEEKWQNEKLTNLDKLASGGFWSKAGASALSVGHSLLGAGEHIVDSIDYAKTGEMDDNFYARASSTIRGRVSEDVDWKIDALDGWDAFDFVYNTGMSAIDSATVMWMPGGMGSAVLGLSAAGQGVNDALDRGLSNDQAFWQGFASGAFEMAFEKLSIGNFKAFKDMPVDGWKTAFKNLGKTMFVNASEEMLTEFANIMYDTIAHGDLSQYEMRVQELLDSDPNMSEAEAKRKAALEFGAQIGEAGLSGGFMGFGFGSVGNAGASINTNSIGKSITANNNVDKVFNMAQISPEASAAYEAYTNYANKGISADNAKAKQVGALSLNLKQDAVDILNDSNSTEAEKAKAEQVLRDLDAYSQNTSVSRFGKGKVKELFGNKEKVQTLIDDALKRGEGTEAYKLATEYKAKIESGKELTEKELTKLVDATTSEVRNTTRTDAEQKLRELGEGDNAVELSKIISKAATGQMLSSAETEAIANNENARKVFAEMDKSSNIELMEASEAYEGGDAELFLENYEGGDIDKYRASFDFVSSLAKNNYDADFILEHRGALTPRQVQNIYSKVVAEPRAEQQRKLDELVKNHEGQLVRKANIDDSIFNGAKGQKLWRNLNSRQKKAITFVKAFAKGAGINLKITYNGKYKGKAYNGYYDNATNTIVIDARAGFDRRYISEDAIIPTMSHELTHWMKQKSPELYAKLSKQIFDVFKAKGYTEYDLIATEKQKHPDMSDDDARDEIIARASEDLFKMSEEGKKIFDSLSEAEKKTLVGKIKELIKNLVDWANELLGLYESKSDEAGWLREFKDELSEIAKTWDQMLAKAVEVNAALTAERTTGEAFTMAKKNTAGTNGVKFSFKDNTNSESKAIIEIIKNNLEKISSENKFSVHNDSISNSIRKSDYVYGIFKEQGEIAHNSVIGNVELSYSGAKSTVFHGFGESKLAATKAIKTVIEKGDIIGFTENYENSGTNRYVVSSKGKINGKESYIGVVIKTYPKNKKSNAKFYLHEAIIIETDSPILTAPQLSVDTVSESVPNNSILTSPEKSNEEIVNNDGVQMSEKDTEYLELAKNPEQNKTKLEEMVAEAAKTAMPDSKVVDSNGRLKHVYHGTSNGGHTWFDTYAYYSKFGLFGNGAYFTEDRNIAEQYTRKGRGTKPQVYSVFLNITNPIDMDAIADIEMWNEAMQKASEDLSLLDGEMTNEQAFRRMVEDLEYAEVYSYDAAEIVRNVFENMGYNGITHIGGGRVGMSDGTRHRVWIAFEPEQIKSADAVTYDDNGNVIPISERFNPEKTDIRFSEKDTGTSAYDIMGEKKALEKRYNKLAADFANYKERVKLDKTLTKGKVIDPKQLEAVARYLVKFADSDYKASELAKMLNDLYVDIQDGAMDDSMSWDEMYSKAYEVAKEIRSEARIKIERPALYDKILKDIRSARIAPNEGQKGDAKHRFGEHYVGKFRGRVTIANDGTPLDIKWSEWAAEYPSVFDKDIGDAQQLVELYDIYDDLRNAGDVVQEYEESEVLNALATEIINKAWTVTKFESTADKQNKRIQELNAEHRKAMEELKDTYTKKVSDAKLLEQMYYGKELLKKDKKIAEQRLADDIHYGKILNDLRTKRQVDVDRAKAAGRERLAQYRENVERNGVVKRITTNSLKLTKMLADNSKDSHVPETLKGAVKELLEAIDASSKQWLETGVPTKQDISLNKAFSRLNTVVAKGSQELGDVLEEMYGSGIDESLMEFVEQIDNGTVYFLNEMSIDDLNKLDKIVRIIKSSVNKVNMYHVALSGLSARMHGAETISDLEKRTKIYDDDKHHFDKLKTKMYWNNLNPYYAFKNLGGSAQEMFRAFQDGQDKIAFLAKEVIDFADGLYTAKEYKKWSDTYFDFSIPQPSGKVSKFSMNVPQIMSLYCVIKQEDARNHILHGDENGEGGGITIAETKDKKAVRRNIRITEADLENILSKLDDKRVGKAKGGTAMAVADKLQEYMGTRGAELGNEITMARWGIKSFGIENYFPIKVSEGAVPSKGETPGVDSMRMLELLNASFTHSRNHMSKKSVEIGDVFDVFSSHMSDMIRYNALALPILDMYKWINYKGVSEAGEEFSLQTSVKEAFGDYAWGYLQTFLKDISGASKSDTRDNLAIKFFKNSKIAKVAGNMRVALLQFTSFIRAGAVMDNKYLLHALHHIPKIKRSEEKSGIVLWKSLGYYDTDITRGLTDKIKHDTNAVGWLVDTSLKGAELADKVTMGVLWNACELEIRDTRKDLKVGSPEFNEAVALRLREVIYKTQVVDSMLTRSQMMRSPSGWDKMLTTFASESTLSLNLMTDIFVSTQLEARETNLKEAMRKNGKYVRKAITAYVMTNIVTTVLQSLFDAFRDYDEDDKDEKYWAKLMLENFAVNSSMFAKIPYINLFVSTLQGFTASRADTDWMNSTVKTGKEIYKLMTGSGDPEKLLKYLLKAGSDVTGIAAYNVYRDIMAFYMFLAGNS